MESGTVSLSGTTSNVHIAKPTDTIVINGRVMRIDELVALLSSPDSAEALRLRSRETHNHEISLQVGQPQTSDRPCSVQLADELHPCAKVEPKPPSPVTRHQQK